VFFFFLFVIGLFVVAFEGIDEQHMLSNLVDHSMRTCYSS